ncbi:MAG: acyl-CoA thioesterase [Chitinophagaceae bacterium]|nr:acyl-CoA thioesterase [Chitinophagaceae bacterium]
MIEINLPIQIRWADLDPNFHVLHSKYYDFGAFCRMVYLTENGISTSLLTENNIGPILLKEDCTFRRELKFEDKVSINLKISWYSKNGARWGMQHQIFKNDDILSATINIEGAWMDTQLRKLTAPPEPVISLFENTQKTVDFFVK